ncbi:MAG TPA: histidine kinase [Acidobacteriota bacterium]|nr:histidine kinase [Acidobacteriota bacterium]HNB71194.1 histidine kinase [Acidobacteriota bacterium]HND21800.1 histidine kinase [Acidobacteriota bacterium]HNG93061.1 histidine kinase [Acidobacteriota bacterium]HNJ42300.1 histidine kinase [Acidobacteriota bacterium]
MIVDITEVLRTNRWAKSLALLGIWTIVATFFSLQGAAFYWRRGETIVFSEIFLPEFTFCLVGAVATPGIIWISSRLRIERQILVPRLLLHLICSLFFSVAWMTIPRLVNQTVLSVPFNVQTLINSVIWGLDRGVMVYWVIILLHHSYVYQRQYFESQLQTSRLETQLVNAQLQSLKMQLQPHFLFNTLNSISTLVLVDPKAAHKMVAQLGDFLRLTLENSSSQEVSFQRELEFLKCYLAIEQTRFQDRLSVMFDIDPTTQDALVPNLLLQPIVENAIKHGIAPRATPGIISIKATQKTGRLHIEINDDGPGLSRLPQSNRKPKGIGLHNTRERLEQLYGDQYRLELVDIPQGGLSVVVEFPLTSTLGSQTAGLVYERSLVV